MDLDSLYAMSAGTSFRYEDFGGVVYQRAGDRLHFIKSRLAIRLLSLAGTGTVRELAAELSRGTPGVREAGEHILKTLHYLEELGIIYELGSGEDEAEGAGLPDLAGHGQV